MIEQTKIDESASVSKSASIILKNFEISGQVITAKLEKLAMMDSSFKNRRMKIGIGKYNITVNINKKSYYKISKFSKSLRQMIGQSDRKGLGYKVNEDSSDEDDKKIKNADKVNPIEETKVKY